MRLDALPRRPLTFKELDQLNGPDLRAVPVAVGLTSGLPVAYSPVFQFVVQLQSGRVALHWGSDGSWHVVGREADQAAAEDALAEARATV